MSDFHGRAISLTGELALDADGRFLAIRFDDRADLGAYGGAFGSFIATKQHHDHDGRRLSHSGDVRAHAARVHQYCAGLGVPRRGPAGHRLCDRAARGLRRARARLRSDRAAAARISFRSSDAVQDAERGRVRLGRFRGGHGRCACSAPTGPGFRRGAQAAAQRAGKLRGIGIATYLEAGGGGAAPKDQVAVEFDANGAMTLYAVTQSSGQGHETVFPQIVAETARHRPRSHPLSSQAARRRAGRQRHRRLARRARHRQRVSRARREADRASARPHAAAEARRAGKRAALSAKGAFQAGDRSLGFIELARALAGPKPHPLDTTAEGMFGMSYPNGCHIAEVEIDPRNRRRDHRALHRRR